MGSIFGVRCFLKAQKWQLHRIFAFTHTLASDTGTPIFQCKHYSSRNLNVSDFCWKYVFSDCFIPSRSVQLSSVGFCENDVEEDSSKNKPIDPRKDRSRVIPPDVSIRYMKSKAYRTTYGDEPVWVKYRRNFKGQFPPKRTRRFCIENGVLRTGNPCPICRDEYLVVHYSNVELLKQFISPHTGEIYPAFKSNVCQLKQFDLEVAIEQAKDLGLLTFEVPFRTYNYEEYYPQLRNQNEA